MLNRNKACEVITKKTKKGSTYKTWIFKCSECEGRIAAQATSLKTHSGKCRRCTQLGRPYEFILNELKNHKRTDIEVTLTYEQIVNIILNQKGCHYCGSELIYHEHSKVWNVNNSRAHQLDRKDNNLAYAIDNVVPCCWECNRLKSDRFSYKEFMLLSPILKKIMEERLDK